MGAANPPPSNGRLARNGGGSFCSSATTIRRGESAGFLFGLFAGIRAITLLSNGRLEDSNAGRAIAERRRRHPAFFLCFAETTANWRN